MIRPQPSLATPFLLIPLAALLAILPLLLHGSSCGHDLVFHVQGWYDAAAQLRHGHYPHWSFTSAWNAGEPRFIFYPPLSWLLGAAFTLIFPPNAAVSTFIFLTLTLAGLTMYRLASHFTTPDAALIAAALYLANPYMLLNAFERSAFAELLASAWIPLLLLAVLRKCPTIHGIAIPLALLWLTNAPAAVMASYALALLATFRVLANLISSQTRSSRPEPERGAGAVERPLYSADARTLNKAAASPLRLTLTYVAGTALGLTLPAFYLIPAAYERRFIQVAMAVIPGMRIQDNFLFTRTTDAGHNGVNLQISLLALTLLGLTFAVVATLLIRAYSQGKSVFPRKISRGASNSAFAFLSVIPERDPLLELATLTAVLILMLTPISTPIWNHLPELHYLQFPWRLLTLVSAVLTFTTALLLNSTKPTNRHPPSAQDPGAPCLRDTSCMSGGTTTHTAVFTTLATLILPLTLGYLSFHLYAQFCQLNDRPTAIAQLLQTHHGFPPTDEYTPNNADSDVLRTGNPAYWLIPQVAAPNTPAPNTLPTPAELNPNLLSDDTPIPITQTISAIAPTHLTLILPQPETLILNLRDYPNWAVTVTGPDMMSIEHYQQQKRDDGLIAVQLPRGERTLDIDWRTTPDQQLGLALSACALSALALTFRRRKSAANPA
jgi:hypothetical protein